MVVTFAARPGARNVGSARPDAPKAAARADFCADGDETTAASSYDVHIGPSGDVILTPREPGSDALTPEQQAQIDKQHDAFNLMVAQRAELMREAEILREMATQQRKLDDEHLKKLIEMI